MKRSQRTRIWVDGDRRLLRDMAKEIAELYSVQVIHAPAKGLVMMKMKDVVTFQPFYMGEAAVTECTVSVADAVGFGIVMGDDAGKAYELAVVDGAWTAGLPETAFWRERLLEEERRLLLRHRLEQAQAKRTKVFNHGREGE